MSIVTYPKENDGSLSVDLMRLSIVLVAFSLERHVTTTTFVTLGFVVSCLQASTIAISSSDQNKDHDILVLF